MRASANLLVFKTSNLSRLAVGENTPKCAISREQKVTFADVIIDVLAKNHIKKS
jgi:hypothetical protein